VSALNPSDSDSASAITPRRIGIFEYRSDHRGASFSSTLMSPVSGMRTATAHDWSPRIITPSTTAWPPM
jgi:hypothetical protein